MKILGNQIEKTITHRFRSGWQKFGHCQHPADTRTATEINNNLDVYAEKHPEIQKFIKELKNLSPEHKALTSDVIERAYEKPLLMTDINFKENKMLEKILSDIIEAARINPEALGFLRTVLNNTDTMGAKYAMACMSGGILKNQSLGKQFEAAKDLVPQIAEQTLSGGYLGTFEKEKNFMDIIKTIINKNSKPENIRLFKDAQKAADPFDNAQPIYIDSFVQSEAPLERIKDNIKTLPDVAQIFNKAGKELDTTEYLTKNVNLY